MVRRGRRKPPAPVCLSEVGLPDLRRPGRWAGARRPALGRPGRRAQGRMMRGITTAKALIHGCPYRPLPRQTGRRSIPRISHDQRHEAASGGIWLHGPQVAHGNQSTPELVL
jgi:hypothetical protein